MHLSSYLKERGHDVVLLDWAGESLNERKREQLTSLRADVVGFHVKISSVILRATEASRWAREAGSRVVWGGPGPTIITEEVLRGAAVDAVVRNEGEVTFVELLDAWERGTPLEDVKGLAFLREGRVVTTGPRERIKELDSLPLPDWRGLDDLSRYFVPLHGRSTVPIVTSRGCPGRCGFCYAQQMWGGKWKAFSPSRVIEQMEQILSLDERIGGFLIIDDLFYAAPTRVQEICQLIRDRGLDIVWNCEIRADLVKPFLLQEMYHAGCRQVLVGVETGSPRLLSLANKQIEVEDIVRASRMIHQAGMELYAMLVYGLPTETEEDVRMTERLLKEIRPEYTESLVYMPYPGTPLYDLAVQNGFQPPQDLEEWGQVGTFDLSSVETKGLSSVPGQVYEDLDRRTKRRAVVRSYISSLSKDPLTAPVRGMRYLFRGSRDKGEPEK